MPAQRQLPKSPKAKPPAPAPVVALRGLTLLRGSEASQVALCEVDGHHYARLVAAGWRHLGELSASEIRGIAPKSANLPPRAKPETLASLLLQYKLGG